jgi:hypothetical protein
MNPETKQAGNRVMDAGVTQEMTFHRHPVNKNK